MLTLLRLLACYGLACAVMVLLLGGLLLRHRHAAHARPGCH